MHTEDHERPLFHRIFDSREDDVDVHDPILNSWIKPLLRERRPICFERLFNLDVIPLREAEAAAAVAANEAEAAGVGANVSANMDANEAAGEVAKVSAEVESQGKNLVEVQNQMVSLTKTVEEGLKKIFELLGAQDTRLKGVESFVESQKYEGDFGFHDSSPRTRYGGGTSGGTSVGVTVGREDLEKEKEKESGAGDEDLEKGKGKEIVTDGEDDFESDEDGEAADMDAEDEDEADMDAEDEDEAEAVDDGVMLGKKRISKPSKVSKSPFTLLKTKTRTKKASEKKD